MFNGIKNMGVTTFIIYWWLLCFTAFYNAGWYPSKISIEVFNWWAVMFKLELGDLLQLPSSNMHKKWKKR